MVMSQQIGFASLLGGASAVVTNLGLRMFASNEVQQPATAGEEPSKPFFYEHAPLMGLVPVAISTFISYKWLGGAPAAIACAITGLFAATAPPIDDWAVSYREEMDSKAKQESGTGVSRYASYQQRLANLGKGKRAA